MSMPARQNQPDFVFSPNVIRILAIDGIPAIIKSSMMCRLILQENRQIFAANAVGRAFARPIIITQRYKSVRRADNP